MLSAIQPASSRAILDEPALEPWYALRVRSGAESKSRDALQLKGLPVFLPTYCEFRHYSDRIKRIERALFPGYLFCRFDVSCRLPVLTARGVESIVGIGGAPEPVPDAEIEALQTAVSCGAPVEPWPYLRAGDDVTVEFGSMRGLRGVVVNARGSDFLVLSVNLLERSVAMKIDRAWVRPLQPAQVLARMRRGAA
jgi:transcription antitermination factor NusG